MKSPGKSRAGLVALASKPVKPPKGFIMINLAAWERDEMNQLARECGIPFNHALRWAVSKAKEMLREQALVARRTGLNYDERRQYFSNYPREIAGN